MARTKKAKTVTELTNVEMRVPKLKNAVKAFYDVQTLRQQSGSRAYKKAEEAQAYLDEEDKKFFSEMGGGLHDLEKMALKEVARLLKGIPIYEEFLSKIKGIGPTMAGVLISETNIARCENPSELWSWYGLGIHNGVADRRQKGQRTTYDPWRKSKIVKVMTDCLIKSANIGDDGKYYVSVVDRSTDGEIKTCTDEDGHEKRVMKQVPWPSEIPPYRAHYDDYKHRKQSERVPVCAACGGKGKLSLKKKKVEIEGVREDQLTKEFSEDELKKEVECKNCGGTGGPAPWGKSDMHRHQAACRYLAKMLLKDLWWAWRVLDKLPVRPSYAEEKLGIVHHGGPIGFDVKKAFPAPQNSTPVAA